MMYAIIGIAVLVLILLIVRWLNLPKTIEQRRLAAEEKAARDAAKELRREADRKARDERRQNRTPIFGRRKKPTPEVK